MKRKTKIFLVIVFVFLLSVLFWTTPKAQAATTISYIGTCNGTTSCTPPAHQVGDLFIAFVGRNSSATAPTLPAGWTSVTTDSINGTSSADSSYRLACKVATTTSETVTGFTNGGALVAHVYRGQRAGLTAACASTILGTPAKFKTAVNTTSTTETFNSVTNGDASSWDMGFGYAPSATAGMSTAPTNMTNRSARGAIAGGHDTNGTRSSWSTANVTITTASRILTAVIEIKARVATTPSFDVGTGTYNNNQSVTISGDAGDTFCYTTDDSTPAATTPGTCSTGSTYSVPVSITATGTVLKAIATKAGTTNSAEQSATYTLTVGAITSSPGAGTYPGTQSVTLNIATTTGAVAHYTTDGSAVTCSSTTYSGAFNVSTTTTVKAIGCKTNYNSDTAISDLYTINVPAAPTNVAATDGTYTNKVTITWTKSTGAIDYHVWRDSTDLGAAGDVATFDDTGADAPTITPGTAAASDGTSADHVSLSLSGASTSNGTTHTYKVVASNGAGNSADSATNTGYRSVGSLTYQWQRSAADSDASYSNISGATTASYDDTGAPANGDGRYYKCVLNATGASQQTSTVDRGYRNAGTLSVDIVNAGGAPVGSPSVSFSAETFDWVGQTSTGSLGTSSQKIRLTNTTGNGSWNLAVGATSGASTVWQGGTYSYDYNDSAANGRLRVDPSAGTITPEGGCGAASPSKGSAAYFDAGNSVTLLTSTTSFGCYWDFTGVALTQDIPAQQQADSYSIGMTLTAS